MDIHTDMHVCVCVHVFIHTHTFIHIYAGQLSGQILSILTSLPFLLLSFHLCVFFVSFLPGTQFLCQSWAVPSKFLLLRNCLAAVSSKCFSDIGYILSAGRYLKIGTFYMAFLCGLYYFSTQFEISEEHWSVQYLALSYSGADWYCRDFSAKTPFWRKRHAV